MTTPTSEVAGTRLGLNIRFTLPYNIRKHEQSQCEYVMHHQHNKISSNCLQVNAGISTVDIEAHLHHVEPV